MKGITGQALVFICCAITVLSAGCGRNESDQSEALKALTIALEANMEFRQFETDCGFFSGAVASTVVLIPLKQEVIEAAVAYKAAAEGLPSKDSAALARESYHKFLDTGESAFILLVLNQGDLNRDRMVLFDSLASHTTLSTENGTNYRLLRYTQNFDEPLNPGWNKGYLYFQDFRLEKADSYSVHFGKYFVKCKGDEEPVASFAFSFDESHVNYLRIIQTGVDTEELRKRFVVTPYKDMGFDAADFFNMIKFLIKLL